MPGKRISRKFIPRPSHGRGRRESRPNVYIQPEKAERSGSMAAQEPLDSATANGSLTGGAAAVAVAKRPARVRVGAAKADIYTRTLGKELRQIFILAVISVAVVIILEFTLN